MSSEKLYNKRAWSEGRGQLACGKTVKYFSVSAPDQWYGRLFMVKTKMTYHLKWFSNSNVILHGNVK